jgi:prepilin-type N-terminal cleavage/methylation domain-containing protein
MIFSPRRSVTKSQNGFSLLEVMVGMAVAAVLTYVISQMLVNSGKQATAIQSKGDFNSFTNQLQGTLNNTATCLAAINPSKKLEFTLSPAGTFVAPSTNNPLPINTTLSVGGVNYGTAAGAVNTFGGNSPTSKKALKITQLQITSFTSAGTTNPAQYVASLALTVDRSIGDGATATGGNTLTKNFNLILTLDLANPDPATTTGGGTNKAYPVVGCAAQFSDYWVSTNENDILYTGGAVGIGVCPTGLGSNPNCVDPPTPGANGPLLDVAGKIQALTYMSRSDARLKENVRNIPQALERVLQLHGVIFDWKAKRDPATGRDQLGFIAQEVEKVFPEVVITDSASGMKSVGYSNLIAPVIEAFKEQDAIIVQQQREIAELKAAVLRRKGNAQ